MPSRHPAALPLPYHAELGHIQVTPLHGFWSEDVACRSLVPFSPPMLLSYRPRECVAPLGDLLVLFRVPELACNIDAFEVVALGRPEEQSGPMRLLDVALEHCRSLEDFMRDLLVLVQAPEIPRTNRMHPSSLKLMWIPLYTALPSNPASFTRTAEGGAALGSDELQKVLESDALLQVPSAVPAVSGLVPRWAKRGYASRTELGSLPTIREKMLGTIGTLDADEDEEDEAAAAEAAAEIPPEAPYGRAEELAGEHPPDESEVLPGAPGPRRRCRSAPSFGQLEAALRASERPVGVTALVRDYLDQYADLDAATAKGPPPQVPVLRSVDWIKRIVRSSGIYDIGLVRFEINPNRPIWVRRNALMIVEEHLLQRRGELKTLKVARKAAEQNVNIYESREAELNADEDERSDSDGDDDDDDDDDDAAALEEQAQASLMRSLLPAPSSKRSAEETAQLQRRATARVAAMSDAEYERQMEVHRKRIRLQAVDVQ